MQQLFDFHSHILPGIDDGSPDLETSLKMLELSYAQGVTDVVATPHFDANEDSIEAFLARRDAAEAALRQAMAGKENLPNLHIGAEVFYFPGISDCDILSSLAINNKKHILIEMPSAPWSEQMFDELEGILYKQALIPIIAHVERYGTPWKMRKIWKKLQNEPVLIQCNAEFFIQSASQKEAMKRLQKGQIHLLGSDCHDLDLRQPNIRAATEQIEAHCDKAWVEELMAKAKECV